jgi:hypothetical protein
LGTQRKDTRLEAKEKAESARKTISTEPSKEIPIKTSKQLLFVLTN